MTGVDATKHMSYDVIVIGGSSAAVGAAIGAGRHGSTVALIEDTGVLGGMLANGVCAIDAYSLASCSGVFEDFRNAVKTYYEGSEASEGLARIEMPVQSDGHATQADDPREGGVWEPHVADLLLKQLVQAVPSIDVYYWRFPIAALKQGNRVVGVVTEESEGPDAYAPTRPGRRIAFRAGVVIDASHEADVATWAGVPYRVGREARTPVEPHAGVIRYLNLTGEIEGGSGSQDRALVSYGVRLTAKVYPGMAPVIDRPLAYDAESFEPTVHSAIDPCVPPQPAIPGGKFELNENPRGNEIQGINWSWPDATREERRHLYRTYCRRALDYLYHLQQSIGLRYLGLPDDEFIDNGGLPYRLYARESRRIVGEATFDETSVNPFLGGDGLFPPLEVDSIAIGHYPIDSKPVSPKVDLDLPDKGQGDFFLVGVSAPFQVPFGVIVPQLIDGLLVPAAVSATHVGFSALRMDPTWMALGQAAGVCAALATRLRVAPRSVPVDFVQHALLRQGAKLCFYWDVPADHPAFAAIQWMTLRRAVPRPKDGRFRPDDPITRGEAADFFVLAFDLWTSVSDVHFGDVPTCHPAFRSVETLFDHRALSAFGITPAWKTAGGFNPSAAGFAAHGFIATFQPDAPLTWADVTTLTRDVLRVTVSHPGLVELPEADLGIEQDAIRPVDEVLANSWFGSRIHLGPDWAASPVSRGALAAYLACYRFGQADVDDGAETRSNGQT